METFRDEGFLPEAVVNYLALLGWSYDDHTTFFTREDLVEKFDLSRVSRNPAAFDREKLEWMNGHYIREMAPDRFAELLGEVLAKAGIDAAPDVLREAAPLVQERMKLLSEAPGYLRFLFEDVEPDEKARKILDGQGEYIADVAKRLDEVGEWSTESIKSTLETLAEERGLSKRKGFQPVRAAVTGTLVSPPLFESMALLGRDRTLERLRRVAA